MLPTSDLGDDLFYQPKATADVETLHSDLRNDIFASTTTVDRKSNFQPKGRINNTTKTSKTSASEGPSSTSNNHDAADAPMLSTLDLGDDLFYQPKAAVDVETLHSDLQNDIFAPTTTVDRKSNFQPKARINNTKTSKTSAYEGPSFTSNNHDVADAPMFPTPDLGDDLFFQLKATTNVETLHSDLRNDIFALATTVVADRKSKFQPKTCINNNRSPAKTSKTRASEGPSSTSNNHDAADAPMLPTNLGDDLFYQPKAIADAVSLHSDLRTDIFAPATIVAPMLPTPDLGDDLFYQPKATADVETLHSDLRNDIFAPATIVDRKSNFQPKACINNTTKTSKTSASEGPSSTSNNHDAADQTLHSDLRNDIFAPATTVDRKSKFQPKARINDNRSPAKTSKTSAFEGPFSTSNNPNAADDEHVEKFQLELQEITSGNPVDPVSEYSHFDSLPIHDESIDAYGPNFSAGDLNVSLENEDRSYFPIYSDEERACCGNSDDLNAQSLTENEDLHTIDGEFKRDHIEESNFVECAPNIAQNDEAEKSSRKVRQRSKKLKINVDNVASIDQNTKITISEIDDDYNDDGCKDDDISKQKKRKLPRKSTSRSSEHKRSIKNSKKNSKEPGSTVNDPPKKGFPHGTSRCRSAKRQVNKALLEIPDDELDRRQLVLRDLIRLAGFKERLSNKVAAVLKNSIANKSVEHEQGLNSEDANGEVRQEGPRLNYHSYMRRPLQTRWSKADTEIFYQAIRQFGTDFEMIQVLFPDRSRQQVKAKFKNEQRKHPLQIADALVYRSKDHSHFEKVIQHLQTMAEQNSEKDASDPTAQSQDEADQKSK